MILDGFHRYLSFYGFFAHISAESTLLDSAKGNIGTEHGPRVDCDLAWLECLGDTVSTIHSFGELAALRP